MDADDLRADRMRDRADRLVPEADLRIWRNNRDFFRHGSSGYWFEDFEHEIVDQYAIAMAAANLADSHIGNARALIFESTPPPQPRAPRTNGEGSRS